jgi:hypothetical protein
VRTPSGPLLDLGLAFNIVPSPPDERLAAMLSAWWSEPRSFGCVTARTSPAWTLVMPDPRIWCAACAVRVFEGTWLCAYCGRRVARRRAALLAFEMGESLSVLGRAHGGCVDDARRS